MKDRTKKKRDEMQRVERARLEKKRRLERVLARLGLLQRFGKLPGWVRERVVRALPTDVVIRIDPEAQNHAGIGLLKRHLELTLKDLSRELDGVVFGIVDYLAVCSLVRWELLRLAGAGLSEADSGFLIDATTAIQSHWDKWRPFTTHSLAFGIHILLVAASDMAGDIFGCQLDPVAPERGQPLLRLTLGHQSPTESRIEIDGQSRRVYRCGLPNWSWEIHWFEADGQLFGLDAGHKFPLFIQPHALVRLRERFSLGGKAELVVRFALLESLSLIEIVERQGHAFFIALKVGGCRMGYLLARVVDDAIVITTALFLTMEGTPEHRLLWRQLRVGRWDIAHLALDRLETFLSPEFLADEEVVRLLNNCGCGSLLQLHAKGFPCDDAKGDVEAFRRFLGMSAVGGDGAFKNFGPLRSRTA